MNEALLNQLKELNIKHEQAIDEYMELHKEIFKAYNEFKETIDDAKNDDFLRTYKLFCKTAGAEWDKKDKEILKKIHSIRDDIVSTAVKCEFLSPEIIDIIKICSHSNDLEKNMFNVIMKMLGKEQNFINDSFC